MAGIGIVIHSIDGPVARPGPPWAVTTPAASAPGITLSGQASGSASGYYQGNGKKDRNYQGACCSAQGLVMHITFLFISRLLQAGRDCRIIRVNTSDVQGNRIFIDPHGRHPSPRAQIVSIGLTKDR